MSDVRAADNITAKRSVDGSVAIQFGGCDGNSPELPADHEGWNYMVRLYRPRAEVLSVKWSFPAAQLAQ